MAGAFVALEGAEGFLPDSEGGKSLTEGSILAVQVTRAAQGGKGPRLTADWLSSNEVWPAAALRPCCVAVRARWNGLPRRIRTRACAWTTPACWPLSDRRWATG